MFERFTERARQVIVLAQEEARTLKHNYIGTEHILLGLLREEEGIAARVLESLGVTVEHVRALVIHIAGSGEEVTSGQIPFTPRAKKVLELALREALSLGHNYIGTEHILLGIVRENAGIGMRIMQDFDADSERVRTEIIRVLSGGRKHTGGGQHKGEEDPTLQAGYVTTTRHILSAASGYALELRHAEVAPIHVLLAMVSGPDDHCKAAFEDAGLKHHRRTQDAASRLQPQYDHRQEAAPPLNDAVKRLIRDGHRQAKSFDSSNQVKPYHLLIALMEMGKSDDGLRALLHETKLNRLIVMNMLMRRMIRTIARIV